MSDDREESVGQAVIACPSCGTSTTVPLEEWEAIVTEHNEQRHDGIETADLEQAILPKRRLVADGGRAADEEDQKPTPPVPPTSSTTLAKHEKTVGTRVLEREYVTDCDCGGRVYFVERTTGRILIDFWDRDTFDADEFRLSNEREQIERYQECDRCGWRVDV